MPGCTVTKFMPKRTPNSALSRNVASVARGSGPVTSPVVWSVVGGRFTHHNASVQVFADGQAKRRLVWIADLLPNDLEPAIRAMINQAAAVMKPTLERA